MLINTGKNTPIIDSNGEKGINSQKKFDEIVLHPMHGAPPVLNRVKMVITAAMVIMIIMVVMVFMIALVFIRRCYQV